MTTFLAVCFIIFIIFIIYFFIAGYIYLGARQDVSKAITEGDKRESQERRDNLENHVISSGVIAGISILAGVIYEIYDLYRTPLSEAEKNWDAFNVMQSAI